MRAAFLSLGLMLVAATSQAFTVEEDHLFPATGIARARLSILSTTDIAVLFPLIAAFQAHNPDVAVHYTVAGSQEVFGAVANDAAAFDLVISSAMDLQMKLVNDGFAMAHRSTATAALPRWARWQDRLFAFAQENVVTIVSRAGLGDAPLPQTRRDLIDLLRQYPERFRGRVGTYDLELSGAGYLFATQDSRQSDSFWRLAEVMGGLSPRLYVSTNEMITDLKSGNLVLAYNVLGSYARPRLADDADLQIAELEDYTLTLLRTGFIPVTATEPVLGGAFLDFLLSPEGQSLLQEKAGLPPIDETELAQRPHLRPMRLDPGLLVFLDDLKRQRFLEEWRAALLRE
ncbi:MAG: ABC transporter substrate-binding protein [Albidovulum sp.]